MIGATLFSGGEGAGIGMTQAGISHAWGIEYDDKIAHIARLNGFNVITDDILNVNPETMTEVDILHASPPCPNFSVANKNRSESELDIALAQKVAQFISVLQPKYFTLENVLMYRKSESWKVILNTLYGLGYGVSVVHVNFADYQVPQTRKRMIVRAVKNFFFVPLLPQAEKWIGWYEAVEDLIPTFTDDTFADWQLKRLPEKLKDTVFSGRIESRAFIVDGQANSNGKSMTIRYANEPSFTRTATDYKRPTRGYINGQCKRLTPRAIARFQSFPDDYILPDKIGLSGKILGNACPPLGMQKIVTHLIQSTSN